MKSYVNLTPFQLRLYYLAKFIGLAPFDIRNGNLHPIGFLRKVHSLIIVILCAVWTFVICVYRQPMIVEVSWANQFVFVMVMILTAGSVCSTLLTYAFNSDDMIEIIDQIIAIQVDLKNLGIEDNGGKKRIYCYARIIVLNFVILSTEIITGFMSDVGHRNDGIKLKAFDRIGSIIIAVYFHNAVLIFVETMICIRQHFESLNNKLHGIVETNCNIVSPDYQHETAQAVFTASQNIGLSIEDVVKIKELHRKLHDLVESTTNFHTIPILSIIVRQFVEILSKCYAIYTYVLLSHHTPKNVDNPIAFIQYTVIMSITTIVDLFSIAHVCTTICGAGNATKTVLYEVWNKFYPEGLRGEFLMFSVQLLHKPVIVAAFGFFHLDYSYIYKIFCGMVAYFIIMIQFDISQPNRRT